MDIYFERNYQTIWLATRKYHRRQHQPLGNPQSDPSREIRATASHVSIYQHLRDPAFKTLCKSPKNQEYDYAEVCILTSYSEIPSFRCSLLSSGSQAAR